jgi:signal transduction histidine kinase/ActR/RegA family two-component response regulator
MRGASDEDYRWYALMLQSMEADTEHSLRVMLYVRDIDETKKNELLKRIALEDALAAAETSNTAKSDFLSRMSHEIRTPLNAIIGFSTLAENEVISPKVREYLGKMQVSSKLLLSVINDILDMSAIENQKLKIAKASFSLKEIMLSISTVYYSICRQKGLDFKITASGVTDEQIVGDEMRVNQVLLNLLSNAVKFTESGGAVSLTVEQLAHTREDKIFMRFTVTDTGCGMSEDMLLRLFRPFEQQDAKTASRHGGSGLGLSISKSLVSLMGGDIRVSSELKKGTTFTVDLPFEKAEPETGTFSVSFDKLRILVVDNDTDTIDYISAIMRRIGIRYDVAQSGEQAVSMIKAAQDENFEYNVCFLDWKMNGMDGLDVARIIRKDFQSKVVLIVMSAYDITEIRSEGAAIGVDMFVAKPLFQSTVVDLLTELVVKRTASVPSGMSAASSYDFSGKRALIIL